MPKVKENLKDKVGVIEDNLTEPYMNDEIKDSMVEIVAKELDEVSREFSVGIELQTIFTTVKKDN